MNRAGGGQDFVEIEQGLIEIDRYRLRQAERANAADRVSGQFDHFVQWEHFSLAENVLEFLVLDTSVATRHQNDDATAVQAKRQRLGDAAGFDAVCFGL